MSDPARLGSSTSGRRRPARTRTRCRSGRAAARQRGAVPQRRRTSVLSAGLVVYDVADPLRRGRSAAFESGGRRECTVSSGRADASRTPRRHPKASRPDLGRDRPGRSRAPRRGGALYEARYEPRATEGERYAAHHALLDGRPCLPRLRRRRDGRPRRLRHDAARASSRGSSGSGGDTHTCLPLPGRKLVVVTDEQVQRRPARAAAARPGRRRRRPRPRRGCRRLPGARAGASRAALRAAQPAREPSGQLPQRALRLRHLLQRRPAGLRPRRPGEPREVAHWLPEAPGARRRRRRTTSSSTPAASSG